MEDQRIQRKLAAIVCADVAGYSRLMGEDEAGTLAAMKAHRRELWSPQTEAHGGRVVGTAGDGTLFEFASAVAAVECSVAVQQGMVERNADLPEDKRMLLRVGINIGEVIIDGEDIHGDGVNVAARLQELADPGGISISDDVHRQVEGKTDFAFADAGQHKVKNIARPVHVWRWRPDVRASAAPAGVSDEPLPHPDKPSIAVLPFSNMSGDPEQEYFADGMAEDIITDLSKVSALFVIARNSAFTYKGKAVQVQDVSRELDVRYVVEGSVRKAGNRVRITAQLIDGESGGHLWAERYDRDLTDIFALQDEITGEIVTALKIKLTEREQEQVTRRYTENLEAYDHFLRGRDQVRATNVTNAQAREMFQRAIELDPEFAAAYAILSYCHWRDWFNEWSDDPFVLERVLETAQRFVALDDSLPLARSSLAWAYLWKMRHEQAITEAKYAITLDPNFAEGYARLGEILNLAGRPQEGHDLIQDAMRLDPHFPPNYLIYLGHAYYLMGKYEEAIAALKRSLTHNRSFLHPHRSLAVIFSDLGRKEDAQVEVAEILRINPRASLASQRARMPFADQATLENYIGNLRSAGLPE